jgi:hypothetical protein
VYWRDIFRECPPAAPPTLAALAFLYLLDDRGNLAPPIRAV